MRFTAALLFWLSALVGVIVAYDRIPAYSQFALITLGLVAGVALGWLGRRVPHQRFTGPAAYGCAWLAAALSLYFVVAQDWASTGGLDFAVLRSTGAALAGLLPTLTSPDDIHPNVAAAGLLILLPLGAGGAAWLWRKAGARERRGLCLLLRAAAVAAALPLLAGLLALGLTSSRGGWAALGIAALTTAYLRWRMGSGSGSNLRFVGDALVAAGFVALAASFLLVLVSPTFSGPLGRLSVGSGFSRAVLWRDTLPLIRDYFFSGSGLESTAMVYSTYVFLLHVSFLPDAHSLYLQIAVAQGMVGLVAFLFLVGVTVWGLLHCFRPGRAANALVLGAAAALVGILTYGLVDAGIYTSKLATLLFLPFGFVWALQQPAPASAPARRQRRHSLSLLDGLRSQLSGRPLALLLALAPVAVVLLLFVLPGARAGFQANLGAVSQTQAELSRYAWPRWNVQDELRRSPAVSLDAAIARFGAAAALDPGNITAQRRLGQIALSRGDVVTARAYLERAYALAPRERATRQLLGEVYALGGEHDRAATLWRDVDLGQGQLDGRRWWYTQTASPEQLAALDAAITQAGAQ